MSSYLPKGDTLNSIIPFMQLATAGSVILVLFLFARRLIFKPIKDIRNVTSKIRDETFHDIQSSEGDELKDVMGLCYLMDQKLKYQHEDLARKINFDILNLLFQYAGKMVDR